MAYYKLCVLSLIPSFRFGNLKGNNPCQIVLLILFDVDDKKKKEKKERHHDHYTNNASRDRKSYSSLLKRALVCECMCKREKKK